MKWLNTGLASLASGLLVSVNVTPNVWAARQVTVNPTWSRAAIQQAIDRYDVVKFAPGDYPLDWAYTDEYYRNAFVITKSVKLMAADAHNKPCLYIREGEEVRVFAVYAPSDATVVLQDLKMGAPWNSHIVRCGTFEIRGCEPVPSNGTPGRLIESFGLWVAPMATVDTGEILPCEIGQFTAAGNRFNMEPPAGAPSAYTFYVDAAMFGNDRLHANFLIENNSFIGTIPASIMRYETLKMLNNDFTCLAYLEDLFAGGIVVGCDLPESSAMLNHNRVFLEAPIPQVFDWGLEQPIVQVVTPVSVGWTLVGLGAHNVEVKNTTVSSSTAGLIVPCVVEAWDTHNCVIKETDYSGLQVLPSGSRYNFFTEGWIAQLYGNDVPSGIGVRDAAEYVLLDSSGVALIDNKNPEARVMEYPELGIVRLLGRLRGMSE